MKRTKIRERYISLGGINYESNYRINMYRLVPFGLISYKTIKLERNEK